RRATRFLLVTSVAISGRRVWMKAVLDRDIFSWSLSRLVRSIIWRASVHAMVPGIGEVLVSIRLWSLLLVDSAPLLLVSLISFALGSSHACTPGIRFVASDAHVPIVPRGYMIMMSIPAPIGAWSPRPARRVRSGYL